MTYFPICLGEILVLASYNVEQSINVLYSPPEQRKAAGMIIDLDNGVDLNDKEAREKELKDRIVSRGLNRAPIYDTHECYSMAGDANIRRPLRGRWGI